jgi:hypothetical protein
MEGPALLGVPTVYIEEEGNEQAERMEKWLGKVPNWRQAKIKTLPTRTGRRFKSRDAAVSLPRRQHRVNDAVGAVSRTAAGTFKVIQDRLLAAYDASDDFDAFQEAFIAASRKSWDSRPPYTGYVRDLASTTEGQDFEAALREELGVWWDEYIAWWKADNECTTQEGAIATEVRATVSRIRSRLAGLPTAVDANAGLADFVRDALKEFGLKEATAPLRTRAAQVALGVHRQVAAR